MIEAARTLNVAEVNQYSVVGISDRASLKRMVSIILGAFKIPDNYLIPAIRRATYYRPNIKIGMKKATNRNVNRTKFMYYLGSL